MSKRDRERAWRVLLAEDEDDDLDGVTELAKIQVQRADGVSNPATGAPILFMKALAATAPPSRAQQVSAFAEATFARLNYRPYDLVTKGHRAGGAHLPARLVKSETTRRYTLMCAYPAWRPDSQVALDGHRDAASADAVEDACWSFIKTRQIGLDHLPASEGAAEVVESYIWRADPWVVKTAGGGEWTVHPGDWLLGLVWSPEVWPQVGQRIRGLSIQGDALRTQPSPSLLAAIRERRSVA